MNKHTVYVAGKHFILLSDDKETYVQGIADEVNATITKISVDNPTLDRRGAAVLCALNYADDMHKEAARNKSLSEKAQPLIAQADKQAKQIKELKEELEKKDIEISKLKKELNDARSALKKPAQVPAAADKMKVEPIPYQHNKQNNKPNKGYKPSRQYSLFDNDK